MTQHRDTICLGYHGWNRTTLGPFLREGEASLAFMNAPVRALARAQRAGARLAVRASGPFGPIVDKARAMGIPTILVEDGFLRSVGLGRELATPLSMVLDRTGIHFDPSRPSDLESLIASAPMDDDLIARARRLIDLLRDRGLSKYNVGQRTDGEEIRTRAGERAIVLVPGQVETDAAVLTGSPLIRTNADLLEAARAARPDAFLIYKPHPDVERGFRPGHVPAKRLAECADLVAADMHAASALDLVDEVHTMTSQIGFEALLRGRTVTTYGGPFYAGWGLTDDRMTFPRRKSGITLERLVVAALILYPHYRDPRTGEPCEVEDALEYLAGETPIPQRSLARLGARAWGQLRKAAFQPFLP